MCVYVCGWGGWGALTVCERVFVRRSEPPELQLLWVNCEGLCSL